MMRPANLLPADLARDGARRLPVPAIAAVAAGLAVAGVMAMLYTGAHKTVVSRQAELDTLHAQIASVPQPKPVTTTVSPALGTEKDARQTALDSALTGRVAWDTVLRELSLVLPSDVWLQTLSAKAGAGTATPDPSGAAPATSSMGLTLTGYTYSQAGVARLLSRLALVPKLSNIQLQSSTSTTVETREVVSFSIAANVADSSTGGGS